MSSRESWTPELEETLETDPLVAFFPSRSRSVVHANRIHPSMNISGQSVPGDVGEREPLLGDSAPPRKKPFYRARPLW
jgi:hypothetical protein